MHIPHGVAIVNGKGGVCKTSLATHVAGGAGEAGWRTLLVDTDPQGNARRDFGVTTDDGLSLKNALMLGDPAQLVIQSVRENVDLIAGGNELTSVWNYFQSTQPTEPDVIFKLGELLATVSDDYDLVVFDTPPASGAFAPNTVMAAVGNVVIPTMSDACSLDGIPTLAQSINRCRSWNPELGVLGVVLYGVEKRATVQLRKKLGEVEEMLSGTGIGVLGSVRAASRKATDDLRDMGMLAHEYEQAANSSGGGAHTFSKAARGLTDDYLKVVTSVLAAVVEATSVEEVIDLTDDSMAVAS